MLKSLITTAVLSIAATGAFADTWTLDNDTSKVQFASIKKDRVGEPHHFKNVSGSVSDAGDVMIEIDLTSVETLIDIRNERMKEHVFKGANMATLAATMDMDALNGLAIGDTTIVDVEGMLTLLGVETEVYTEMFVARLSDDRVLVTTDDMLFLRTDDAELDGGIDMLQSLAKLSGITRTSPVTLRLMFDRS